MTRTNNSQTALGSLLAWGANPALKTPGNTALKLIRKGMNEEAKPQLKYHGVDPYATASFGEGVLILATFKSDKSKPQAK